MVFKKFNKVLVLSAVLVALLATYGGAMAARTQVGNDLKSSGSTTVYPVVNAAQTRYKAVVPGTTFTLAQGGTGVGKTEVLNEITDIGMQSSACVSPTDDAGKLHSCADLDVTSIGRDALSWARNKNLPAACVPASLTKQDIINMYVVVGAAGTPTATKRINYWNDLSGVGAGCPANTAIHIVAREVGSGTRASVLDIIKGALTETNEIAAFTAGQFTRANGNPAVEAAVGADPLALGYVGLHFLDPGITPIGLDAASFGKPAGVILPSDATVIDGTYPMSRTLYLSTLKPAFWTGGTRPPAVDAYISWLATSLVGQGYVVSSGYVAIAPAQIDADVNGDKTVDIGDVAQIGNSWLGTGAAYFIRADTNGDGSVDIGDVATVGNFWLVTYP